jgi:hypothetical protein
MWRSASRHRPSHTPYWLQPPGAGFPLAAFASLLITGSGCMRSPPRIMCQPCPPQPTRCAPESHATIGPDARKLAADILAASDETMEDSIWRLAAYGKTGERALLILTRAESPEVRALSISALGEFPLSREGQDALVALSLDPSLQVRREALGVLLSAGREVSVPYERLVTSLHSADDELREYALGLAIRNAPTVRDAITLLRAALADSIASVNVAGLRVAAERSAVAHAAVRRLDDQIYSLMVRRHTYAPVLDAAIGLIGAAEEDGDPLLSRALSDGRSGVRLYVLRNAQLGRAQGAEVSRLAQEGSDWRLRVAALKALPDVSSILPCSDVVREALRAREARVREAAVSISGPCAENGEFRKVLDELLYDSDVDVVRSVLELLKAKRGWLVEVQDRLQELAESGDPTRAGMGREALRALNASGDKSK